LVLLTTGKQTVCGLLYTWFKLCRTHQNELTLGRVDIEGNMAQNTNWHHVMFDRIQSQAATCWVGHSGNATDRNTVVNGRTTPSFKVCYCNKAAFLVSLLFWQHLM